jgi:hypothetical protein
VSKSFGPVDKDGCATVNVEDLEAGIAKAIEVLNEDNIVIAFCSHVVDDLERFKCHFEFTFELPVRVRDDGVTEATSKHDAADQFSKLR